MSKAKMESLREKVDGNELDLSLSNLTEVPVKELAALSKATVLDLSCNNLTTLTLTGLKGSAAKVLVPDSTVKEVPQQPEFCILTHLIKLDLSKNQLQSLPEEIGHLSNLQHLDLYNNKLTMLPLSFSQLRSLRWLDLKDNPLEVTLAKAAGDCLDEKQCRQCSGKVLQHMKALQEVADQERERRLLKEKEQEKKREAKQREREARERETQKKKKAEEKERKRKVYEAQVAAQAAQENQKKKKEEKKKKVSQNRDKKKTSVSTPQAQRSVCSRLCTLILGLLLLLVVGSGGVIAVCQVPDLRTQGLCAPVNLYTHKALSWAQDLDIMQQVIQKISDFQA